MISKPISRKLVNDLYQMRRKVDLLEDQIKKRIDYILKFWCEIFKCELDYWIIDNGNGYPDDLLLDLSDNYIYNIRLYYKSFNCNEEAVIIDKYGSEFRLTSCIPMRCWLFENDFKKEIIDGKKSFEKQNHEKSEKDKDITEQALKKLTMKEIAALKKAFIKC